MYADSLDLPGRIETEPDLLTNVQALVNACISGASEDQKRTAQIVDNELTHQRSHIGGVLKHFAASPKGKTDKQEPARSLFRAIEVAEDDLAQILLCRIAEGLLSDGTPKVLTKRHRRLVKADVCSNVIRALRTRIRNRGMNSTDSPLVIAPLADVATDALAALLLVYGTKDPRLTMKMRMGGLLLPLCAMMSFDVNYSPSPTLLRLLCRAVRSPRNAQLCGRQKEFASRLLSRVSSLEEGVEGVNLMLLARHLELLYFIIKNRKTRIQLIQEGIARRVMSVVDAHLEHRNKKSGAYFFVDGLQCSAVAVHSELCLVSLAVLRLLANNKKVKEELISFGAVSMCEKYITSLSTEDVESMPNAKQLQDSLCALCLRCLPTIRFALAGVAYPIRFPLPRPSSPKRRSISKSPMKRSDMKTCVSPSPIKNKSFEESMSSDDDGIDEEDVIFNLDDSELLRSDGEDEDSGKPIKKDGALTYQKQKLSELSAYTVAFAESEGAQPTARVSWKGYDDALQSHVQATHSVIPFVKAAYPEISEPDVDQQRQLLSINKDSMKTMVVQQMARARMRAPFTPRVVFDLDAVFADGGPLLSLPPSQPLLCDDTARVSKLDSTKDHLLFESRFESGNLRRATQVGPQHYELVLSPDVNQAKDHYQWFYFEVSNMKANMSYTFEIVNCLKTTSMYSRGMQPLMYSVRDRLAGRGGWVRTGDSVCYYRNLYTGTDDQDGADGEKTKKRNFFSIRFNVTFRNKADVCYFAYHFPYTYSYMKASLDRCFSRLAPAVFCKWDTIGQSLGGNAIPMLTITAPGSVTSVAQRESIVLSARVHPGETNASWMMHGILEMLMCSQDASVAELLSRFVVKVIPMLNPDGVINGSHRCSLAGGDLNRVWDKPSRTLHPEIFHSKGIIQYLTEVRGRAPWMFVDLHGHSRRSNVFVFGNNPEESYRSADKELSHDFEFMELPEILSQTAASFSFKDCRFSIVRSKESSARVAVWRQFGVARSYTMEATYSGFDSGAYNGFQVGTRELKEMGRHLVLAILQSHKAKTIRKKPNLVKKGRVASTSDSSDDRRKD